MEDCPECFGSSAKSGKSESCKKCIYRESCIYCAHDNPDKGARHGISYEQYSYSAECASFPETEDLKLRRLKDTEDSDVLQIMEYLLDIDNYTAELASIILHSEANTAADLAKRLGVSRQAVHRKLIDCCTRHPELRKLFITRLYRCRRILKDSKRLEPKTDPKQMKFDF